MDTTDLIKAFFDSDVVNNSVDSLTAYIVTICSATIPLFYCIAWVWSYAKKSVLNLGSKPEFFDKTELIRGVLLWMLVMSYTVVFGAIEGLAFQIIEATEPSNYSAWKANHGAIVVEVLNPSEETISTSSGEELAVNNDSSNFIPSPEEIAGTLVSYVFVLLGYIASTVVGGISYIASKIFYIIGPLAITFSILPPFKDKLDKWFGAWLNATMNLLTMNILTAVFIALSMESMENIGTAIASGEGAGIIGNGNFGMIMFNAFVVVLYILSFWFTSLVVGTSDSGKILSAGAGAATQMIGSALNKGSGKGGGTPGAGGAAGAPNVLGATQDTK